MRISDWSSDVCSSDLPPGEQKLHAGRRALGKLRRDDAGAGLAFGELAEVAPVVEKADVVRTGDVERRHIGKAARAVGAGRQLRLRSEEHTSELQSLMRISYAVFCLKKKKNKYIKATEKLT